ncbi:HNH endonuclease signature motif containing protein [Nocardia sp. NPDC046473]|uniref:HNH endonuclease signature motif containing protein n=1 Tax=Nocardia sp. NPDC046473 TaxID=3155733 RepID=UPI0033D2CC85
MAANHPKPPPIQQLPGVTRIRPATLLARMAAKSTTTATHSSVVGRDMDAAAAATHIPGHPSPITATRSSVAGRDTDTANAAACAHGGQSPTAAAHSSTGRDNVNTVSAIGRGHESSMTGTYSFSTGRDMDTAAVATRTHGGQSTTTATHSSVAGRDTDTTSAVTRTHGRPSLTTTTRSSIAGRDTDPTSTATRAQRSESSTTATDSGDAELRYRPSAALAARVRAIDGTCRAPGCGVPAAATDLDHQQRFDHRNPARGGRTSEDNLGGLCRRHHRLKTLADNGRNGWTVVHHADRRVEWRTPGGDIVTTEPEGVGYLFPEQTIPPSSPHDADNTTTGGVLDTARKPYQLRSVIDSLTDPDPIAVHLGELIALQRPGPLRHRPPHPRLRHRTTRQPTVTDLSWLRDRPTGDEPPPF